MSGGGASQGEVTSGGGPRVVVGHVTLDGQKLLLGLFRPVHERQALAADQPVDKPQLDGKTYDDVQKPAEDEQPLVTLLGRQVEPEPVLEEAGRADGEPNVGGGEQANERREGLVGVDWLPVGGALAEDHDQADVLEGGDDVDCVVAVAVKHVVLVWNKRNKPGLGRDVEEGGNLEGNHQRNL